MMLYKFSLRILLMILFMLPLRAEEQRRIVVVIASYNNATWYEDNLTSVLDQDYDNYRVIYVNDCSPDGTGDLVDAFLRKYDTKSRVKFINNTERKRALRNLYEAIMSCDDEDIVCLLDGDDAFSFKGVLRCVNEAYADSYVWLTFGQFMTYPGDQLGFTRPIPRSVILNNKIRSHNPQPSHLRTFYAKLFKMIKLEDLMYEGDFFPMTYDLAMMMPMMEMAGFHHKFISDVLYIYNEANPINDHKVSQDLQRKLADEIRSRPPYQKLETLF